MIWTYERDDGTTARVETSFDDNTSEYVLRFVDPILGFRVERFGDASAYEQRLKVLEAELTANEWHLSGPPKIVPEGFPKTRPEK